MPTYSTLRRVIVDYNANLYTVALRMDADVPIDYQLTGGFLGTTTKDGQTFAFDPGDGFTKQYNAIQTIGPGTGFILRLRPSGLPNDSWVEITFTIPPGVDAQVAYYDSSISPTTTAVPIAFQVYINNFTCSSGALTAGVLGAGSGTVTYRLRLPGGDPSPAYGTVNTFTIDTNTYNTETVSIDAKLNGTTGSTVNYTISCTDSCDLTAGAISIVNTNLYELAYSYTGSKAIGYTLYKNNISVLLDDNPVNVGGAIRINVANQGYGEFKVIIRTTTGNCSDSRNFTIVAPTTQAPTTTTAPTTQPTTLPITTIPTTVPNVPNARYILIRPRRPMVGFELDQVYYFKCSSVNLSEDECRAELSRMLWDILDVLPDNMTPLPCPADPLRYIGKICVK